MKQVGLILILICWISSCEKNDYLNYNLKFDGVYEGTISYKGQTFYESIEFTDTSFSELAPSNNKLTDNKECPVGGKYKIYPKEIEFELETDTTYDGYFLCDKAIVLEGFYSFEFNTDNLVFWKIISEADTVIYRLNLQKQ